MFCLFLVDSLYSEMLPRVLYEVGFEKQHLWLWRGTCGGENLSSFQKIITKKINVYM